MQASSERLPWLTEEPPKAVQPAARPAPVARAMWPWYLLLLLLVAAVGAGAWWLSTAQQEAPPPQLPAEQSIPIPVTPSVPAAPGVAAPDQRTPPDAAPRVAPAAPRIAERSRPPARNQPVEAPLPLEEPDSSLGRGVFPADEPTALPPASAAAPVVYVNPRPYAGRVVQLGAFPTRAQAEASWRRVVRRYPYLSAKPKMVNTVDVRAVGGGRPTRMYRLQLGTSSQAQSVVICQQLERAGQSCVVVY